MNLRARLLALTISTVSLIVLVLLALHVNSLIVTWLEAAVERNYAAGGQVQAVLLRQISHAMSTQDQQPRTLEESKTIWRKVVADDPNLAVLLEQTMAETRSIIEIGVLDENGIIIASSNPSRVDTASVGRVQLQSILTANPLTRLLILMTSSSDYETRIPLGVKGAGAAVFTIQVLSSPILWRDAVMPELYGVGVFAIVALVLSIGLAVASAQLALSPLKRISQSIDRIAGESLGSGPGPDEVSAVESKLTLLGAHLRRAHRDEESRRVTAIAALTSGVAHEIKNPLNSMALRLDLLRERIGGEIPEAEKDVAILSQEVRRLDRVVRTFLDFTKPVTLDLAVVDVRTLVDEVMTVMGPEAAKANVDLKLSGEPVRIRADHGLLKQAILNLVTNGIQAMAAGGVITAEVSRTAGGSCRISIADTGKGIPQPDLDKIFKLYYTTKPQGSGIGLALVFRAVQLHGGTIGVESEPGRGTRFTIEIPGALL